MKLFLTCDEEKTVKELIRSKHFNKKKECENIESGGIHCEVDHYDRKSRTSFISIYRLIATHQMKLPLPKPPKPRRGK